VYFENFFLAQEYVIQQITEIEGQHTAGYGKQTA